MPVKLIVVRGQPVAHAALMGRLDAASGDVLERKVDDLRGDGYLTVYLDVSAISGVDEHGLAALARVRRRFGDHAGRLTVLGLPLAWQSWLDRLDGGESTDGDGVS